MINSNDIKQTIAKVKKIQGSSNMRRFYTFDSQTELDNFIYDNNVVNFELSTITWATKTRYLLVVWAFD
jgi:hypothetical protein